MFGSDTFKKSTAIAQLAGMLVAAVISLAPTAANAQGFGDMLYSPNQGSSRTLRNPMIPTAPTSYPYQSPAIGQPPPVGDGMTPAPLIQGDLGAPNMVPSGLSDQTHGNYFPTRGGQQARGPENYAPGAGRLPMPAGQQQGMFDFGQGQMNGRGMGPGGPSGGTGWINNGGAAYDASGMGPGGKNGGTGWVNNGGAAGDARGMGPGGASNGTFWGPGGSSGGTGWVNNGGAAADATGMGPGGKNGGTGVINAGGPASDARGVSGGGRSSGVGVVNNGGNAGGTGLVNNGGPRADAQGSSDPTLSHQIQPSRYDFQGPLPTVRTFSRYLVILGVVSATVFISLAAWSMVFGHPYGGSRVMGAAGGLLLLLAGYTIWKIVQMNTFNANSTGWEARYRDGTPMQINGPGGAQANNGPFAPPQNPGNNGGGGGPAPNVGGGGPIPNVGGGPNPNGGAANPNGGAANPNGGAANPNGGAANPNGGGNNGGNNGGFIPILGGN